jgi:hypothetical protein
MVGGGRVEGVVGGTKQFYTSFEKQYLKLRIHYVTEPSRIFLPAYGNADGAPAKYRSIYL